MEVTVNLENILSQPTKETRTIPFSHGVTNSLDKRIRRIKEALGDKKKKQFNDSLFEATTAVVVAWEKELSLPTLSLLDCNK